MKTLKRWIRASAAIVLPLALMRWINRDRTSVQIANDPDGCWTVQIGTRRPCTENSIQSALFAAVTDADRDPSWKWTSDYLRGLP